MKVILASASPRRREILEMLGLNAEIVPAEGEEHIPAELEPGEAAAAVSAGKAREVHERRPDGDIVIAADTIVVLDGEIFGKPRDRESAFNMLRSLSGRTHEVYTGLCVIAGGRERTEYEKTEVTFRTLDDDEITAYINSGEPMDKAGAYGIQGRGALLAERIDGDFFNVMGLPVCRLGKLLKKQGVSLL